MRVSEEQPEILYPKYDYLANLLDSDNHYQPNISINILANLAVIDVENKFEKIFDKYFSNIDRNRTMAARNIHMPHYFSTSLNRLISSLFKPVIAKPTRTRFFIAAT
ncbi:MAG: hypothetical protein ACFFCW_29975 [Candidatus Hodarchaeota archaeon]